MADKKEKYTFQTKLHEVCNDDSLRPMLECIYFENGYAYAGNGHACIKQTLSFHTIIDPENLDGKLLHKDSYRAIMGFQTAIVTEDGIECENDGQKVFFEFYHPKENEKPPNYESILKSKGLKTLGFIGFNPENFSKLCKALHAPSGNIRVQFTGIDTAILVDVPGVEDQEAVIMPVILNDSLF